MLFASDQTLFHPKFFCSPPNFGLALPLVLTSLLVECSVAQTLLLFQCILRSLSANYVFVK